VYLDPPYVAVGRYSDFNRYHRVSFDLDDHKTLAVLFEELSQRGCYVMLSNSYCEFTLKLFARWNLDIVHAQRLINKKSSGRAGVKELVIRNY